MGFWIRNSILAVLLIGLAWGFLANQEYLLSLDNSIEKQAQPAASESTTKKPTVKYQQGRKLDNAAAEGLSNFYAKIYGSSMDKKGPKIRNNIIFLPDPQGDLVKILQAREMVVRPYRKTWRGTTVSRPFRKQQTLYQKLAEYAAEDGLEVIWWINKDFIVKDPFRIEKDILKTAYQVGEAVSGHFPEGIVSYFCYRQRTLVFINEAPAYLDEECLSLKPKSTY
ncbi:MAG: toxin co-regulated pilus biosynthesis Q family protein [Colwellia sp.]|nr:toxin co-regulated pilus biosynthesis Q family protein [Colwellia sp.]MCW8863376.1 toxin co-regulated pilus biosynthesis Q family protein [Colwellia sp.]MCW9080021.1 toxin co-regulated pilus biosynthesis Q family protein [Colwellia sp.]